MYPARVFIYVYIEPMLLGLVIRPEFFISWFTKPPTVIFQKVEKKKFYKKKKLSADSKYYFFCWKKEYIF